MGRRNVGRAICSDAFEGQKEGSLQVLEGGVDDPNDSLSRRIERAVHVLTERVGHEVKAT